MKTVLKLIPILIILFLTACGSNSPSHSSPTLTPTSNTPTLTVSPSISPVTTSTVTQTPIATSPYTVSVATKVLIENYLVDGKGMTLYYTVSDRPNYSNLPDETLTNWPVFHASSIVVPPSLMASDFGTYTRDNNMLQTTYKGYPLYYFVQDKIPGDTLGNKAGGVWFVIIPGNFPP